MFESLFHLFLEFFLWIFGLSSVSVDAEGTGNVEKRRSEGPWDIMERNTCHPPDRFSRVDGRTLQA